jgi:hypothetical protein
MIISQYNIILKRVEKSDIELIRYWRNQPSVRNYMEFKDYITPSMQLKWFESINNKWNYYFLIICDNKTIGLINAKNYNEEKKYGEGGIIIWNKDYLFSSTPVFASLALMNFIFLLMKDPEYSIIKIANSNTLAIQFNKQLGYEPYTELNAQEGFTYYYLSKENYLAKTKKLNKAAEILSENSDGVKLIGEKSPLNLDVINSLFSQ